MSIDSSNMPNLTVAIRAGEAGAEVHEVCSLFLFSRSIKIFAMIISFHSNEMTTFEIVSVFTSIDRITRFESYD